MPFADSNIAEFNDFGKAERNFFTTVHIELFVIGIQVPDV